jgi:hypothetical protein
VGMPSKIPASKAGAGGLCGGRGGCGREEGDGREEGPAAPVEALGVLLITDRVGVICPHNGERLTFVGQEGVGRQNARHGGRNALMKALDLPNRPRG